MKNLLLVIFMLIQVFAFGQTKEDFLECLAVVFEQPEFEPAFSNDILTSGGVVITASQKRNRYDNEFQKIRTSLRQDDFFDFDYAVKVVQGNDEQVKDLGIDPKYVLQVSFNGKEEGEAPYYLIFSTFVRNENMMFYWNYALVKEDGEWVVSGKTVDKRR